MMFDDLDDLETERPPIAGTAAEYQTRIEADRVTAEWRNARRPCVGQEDVSDLPLFGGDGEDKQGSFE